MASLIIVSSLCQFILAAKLSLFRKIFTPTVAGTVLMLIPVTLGTDHLSQAERRAGGGRSLGRPGHGQG